MSVHAIEKPAHQDTAPPNMVHLADYPYTHALCGYKLSRTWQGDETVDCVVCAEMSKT